MSFSDELEQKRSKPKLGHFSGQKFYFAEKYEMKKFWRKLKSIKAR